MTAIDAMHAGEPAAASGSRDGFRMNDGGIYGKPPAMRKAAAQARSITSLRELCRARGAQFDRMSRRRMGRLARNILHWR